MSATATSSNSMRNLGFDNMGHSARQDLKAGMHNIAKTSGQAALDTLASAGKSEENSIYKTIQQTKKVAVVMSFVTADYSKNRIVNAFRNLDFNGSSVSALYLRQLGIHDDNREFSLIVEGDAAGTYLKTFTEKDFTAHQIAVLQQQGYVCINKNGENRKYTFHDKRYTSENPRPDAEGFRKIMERDPHALKTNMQIMGAITKKDQIKAMQVLYKKGISLMSENENLKQVARAAQKGQDALKREISRTEKTLDRRINELRQKSVMKDASFSKLDKKELDSLIKDMEELRGFVESGVIHGGGIISNKRKSQQHYAMRMASSSIMGNEIQASVDLVAMMGRVTKTSVKSAYAAAQNMAYHAAGAAIKIAGTPMAKIADLAISKVTGTKSVAATSFNKRMDDARHRIKHRTDDIRQASKEGRKKEFKRAERIEKRLVRSNKTDISRERQYDVNARQIRLAKKNKDVALERKYEKKNWKIEKKQFRKKEKTAILDRFSQKRIAIRTKINNGIKKAASPFKFITKPFEVFSGATDAVKGVMAKTIFKLCAGIGMFLLVSVALEFAVMFVSVVFAGGRAADAVQKNEAGSLLETVMMEGAATEPRITGNELKVSANYPLSHYVTVTGENGEALYTTDLLENYLKSDQGRIEVGSFFNAHPYYATSEDNIANSLNPSLSMVKNFGNCTCYAWGRFSEIMGSPAVGIRGDGGQFYSSAKDAGYITNDNIPQVGAIACWENPGNAGHVAVVEEINNMDGTLYITISQSGYNSFFFQSVTYTIDELKCQYGYVFQGFIYQPADSQLYKDRPELSPYDKIQ